MSFQEEVQATVDDIIDVDWSSRNGTVVPETEDVVMRNGAVNVDATYLYADLANSSVLGQEVDPSIAAKVVRAYLGSAVRILKHYGGEIRSFDGDRVLAIFIGDLKNTMATRAAFALDWAVDTVLTTKLQDTWPDLLDVWKPKHGVGIDTGVAALVRAGVRESNDLISIGSAPNVAAKLSELRCANIHITKAVYDVMANSSRETTEGVNRWGAHKNKVTIAHADFEVYWSNEYWEP